MELYTNEDSQDLLKALNDALPYIEYVMQTHKPLFDGERYLTSEELCSILKISKRTLQDYRTTGKIPYIQLGGKTLYRESDIQKLLDENYRKAWE